MFRFPCVSSCLRRLLHHSAVTRDPVLEQLSVCAAEEQVFDVVGKNRAKLTVNHVSQAVGMLWRLQKKKPEMFRTVEIINRHPQFLTLRVLAENKISQMDNITLVDILYHFLRYSKLHPNTHTQLIYFFLSNCTGTFCPTDFLVPSSG